jgi:hypothetical protein
MHPVKEPTRLTADRGPHLCCADVAGSLVAPDVLLAGLHGHPQGGLALRVNAHADDAPGQQALVLVVA